MSGQRVLLPLESYVANTVAKKTLPVGHVGKLSMSSRFTINADAGTAVSSLTLDAPASLIAKDFVRLTLGGSRIVSVDPVVLLHSSNWFRGVKASFNAGTPTAGASGNAVMEVSLPINNPFAGPNVNYRLPVQGRDSFLDHQYGPLANYAAAGLTAGDGSISGDTEYQVDMLDVSQVKHRDGRLALPDAYVLRMETHQHPLVSASTRDGFTIMLDNEMLLLGLIVRPHDSSGSGTAQRVDGFIRRFTAKVRDSNGLNSFQTDDMTWAQMKHETQELLGIADAEMVTGMALCFLGNHANFHKVRRVGAKTAIEIAVNTSETVKAGYTAITPAAGDRVDVTTIGWDIKRYAG